LVAIAPALSSVVAATVSVVANQVVVTNAKTGDTVFLEQNVQASQQLLDEIAVQIGLIPPPVPGAPPADNPLVDFVPTTPASGNQ
jgi:hypothetical protein